MSTEDNYRIDDDESLSLFINNTDDSNEVRFIAIKEHKNHLVKFSTLKHNESVLIEANNIRELKKIGKQ